MNDIHICNIFRKCQWKWAKTYEKTAPHWYTKKIWFKSIYAFEFLAQVIGYYGKEEKFGTQTHKYYYCGDFKYWIMSNWWEAILINKAIEKNDTKKQS